MRSILPVLLILTAILAGCTGEGADADDTVIDPAQERLTGMPQLHGWVFDPAVVPIAGVEVQANVGNMSVSVETDADGFYGFDDLFVGQAVILTARADGYLPLSKQTTLSPDSKVQLNFTLEPEPVIEPYHDTLGPFQGYIQCQYTFEQSEQSSTNECGAGSDENQWSISVGPDFAGGVIEVDWTPNTPASNNMRVTLECATPGQCGDHIEPFANTIGPSRLRVEIPNAVATKYFPSGGIILMKVTVDPNNDANEAGVGSAFAASQEFEAIASIFYHEPPPPGFSFDSG